MIRAASPSLRPLAGLLASLLVASCVAARPAAAGGTSKICSDCFDEAVNDTASSPGRTSVARDMRLALDPGIAFVGKDHRVRYALANGPTWTVETVDAIANAGGVSVATDAQGTPTVAYHDSAGTLWLASRSGGTWSTQPIVLHGGVVGPTSLAILPAGIGIAYVDATQGLLMYAESSVGAGWQTSIVAPVGAGPALPSLLAEGPVRAISYRGAAPGGLFLAQRVADGPWSSVLVDGNGDVGGSSSLVGHPAQGDFGIAYYDFTNADLKFARMLPAGWLIETVDGAGTRVGRPCAAVALDGQASGRIGVAYYDQTHGDLDYALRIATGWTHLAQDTTGDVGTSLACGVHATAAADTVGIVYANRNTRDLYYLWHDGGTVGVPVAPGGGALHVAWARAAGGAGHVRFTLGAAGEVRVSILDPQGRTVARPLRGALPAGPADVRWDGRDALGRPVSAGVYFARVETAAGAGATTAIVLH